jgi:tetratricopeptide (TPR) repeat protein
MKYVFGIISLLWLPIVIAPFETEAASSRRKPVVAMLPTTASEPDLQKLGLLIQARASEILEATGRTHELDARQVMAMAKAESLNLQTVSEPKTAELARRALGADQLVTTFLKRGQTGLVLEGLVMKDAGRTPFLTSLSSNWSTALVAGSEAIAKALLGDLPSGTVVQPQSTSESALMALADCWAVSIRQPLGILEPVVIDAGELKLAIASCRKAFELDSSLRFALANMALMQAISGDDRGAAQSLTNLTDQDDMVEAFTLARFWLLTRYQSNEAGLAFLRGAIDRHPAELILRSTLAEDYESLHEDTKSIEVWKALLVIVPNSSVVHGQLSQSEARAGQQKLALASAKRALALTPKSREAKLQVAARHLDLGKLKEAIQILEPLAKDSAASSEYFLKLGWAHWLNGDVDRSAELFEVARATDWRARGRAHYHRALVAARRGQVDAARAAFEASSAEGFRVRDIDPALIALPAEAERQSASKLVPQASDAGFRPLLVPQESSLFPIDPFGNLEPAREKPQPPEGFILFRF